MINRSRVLYLARTPANNPPSAPGHALAFSATVRRHRERCR